MGVQSDFTLRPTHKEPQHVSNVLSHAYNATSTTAMGHLFTAHATTQDTLHQDLLSVMEATSTMDRTVLVPARRVVPAAVGVITRVALLVPMDMCFLVIPASV